MSETGVMGAGYADDRRRRPHVRYRFRVRARLAVRALQGLGGNLSDVRVLDLGAAEAATLLEMRELLGGQGRYDGVELARELIDASAELPDGVRLLAGDVMALPDELEAGSYDLCTALAVLEHLPEPGRCVRQAFRMLKPGGLFVCSCPSPFWDGLAGRLGMVADEHHEQHLDGRAMRELASGAGFAQVEFRPFMWAPVALLPYAGIVPGADWSLAADAAIHRLRLLDFGFVNQAVIARKP